jgi:hypothetical protein
MSGKCISIERPPCGRAFAVSVASWAMAMAFKLVEAAQARWRAVNAPHLVALVRAGARFANGHLVERPDESGGEAQAA